ncbi:MAG: ABC transporter substrate-binding protein [Candidatus Omnitrophota bacterium]
MAKFGICNWILIWYLALGFWHHGDCLAQNPKPRYISLAPSTTEILFALGLDEEIVGVSSYCNYPLPARLKPKIGDFSHPNLEQILALKPDYIFCTGLEQAAVIVELRRQGVKVYVADPKNIEELLDTIREIGALTDRMEAAIALIKKLRREIESISTKTRLVPAVKRPKVFVEIWHEPLMTAGKGSFVDELITFAGGINIAQDVHRPYSIFSAEKVISLNPDCIILAYMDEEMPVKLVKSRFGWEGISAVKNNRVFNDINPDILLRPGPRITEGLRVLYQKLYPEDEKNFD